jgi:glycosyltransferase involved in cell wall biosynthesis
MKKVLVYYPFTLSKEANSGSKLRPLEMKKAFETWGSANGVEIILISGTTLERENRFNELLTLGKLNDLWFCYMENQTIPIWLTDPGHRPIRPFFDKKILKFLKSNGVPIGVFYRDVYWKFDDLYPLKGMKKTVMQAIYRMEEKFYEKYCDIIFLPSLEMGKYVSINRPMVDLPPGGKSVVISKKESRNFPFEAIYVGAIKSEEYGLSLLLHSMELINAKEFRCNLTIVCRENEYSALPPETREQIRRLNIEIKHISGESLNQLYEKMDFAFIPRLCTEYQHFSMPVKLVEYLSNGLPIIATACEAQERFISENQYGLICKDEPHSMAEAIEKMFTAIDVYQENIDKTFLKNHSWVSRVEKVKNSLVEE